MSDAHPGNSLPNSVLKSSTSRNDCQIALVREYTLPIPSTATPLGHSKLASIAGPPSAAPITVVMAITQPNPER